MHPYHLVVGGSVVERQGSEIVQNISGVESKVLDPLGGLPLDLVERRGHADGKLDRFICGWRRERVVYIYLVMRLFTFAMQLIIYGKLRYATTRYKCGKMM